MSSGPSTPEDQWQSWFQAVWAVREDVVYPHLFGDIGKRIATIPAALFQAIGVPQVEEWWLTHGVLTSPPQADRRDWVYVTSGLSNPWGLNPADADKRLPSGLGIELMMQTRTESHWVIPVLHWLTAVQILAASGILEGETVRYGDLVPLGRPVDPESDSQIRNLFLVPPAMEANRFLLDSGTVNLLLCVGITDAEHDFALKEGSDALLEKLKSAGAYPTTDPKRKSSV